MLGIAAKTQPTDASAHRKLRALAPPASNSCNLVALFPAKALFIEPDEQDLCKQAVSGSRAALGRLLERHGPRLYRCVLLPRLGSKDAAQEALGITYGKVVENISRFEWRDVGIYPWLRLIALRVAIDLLRLKKREVLFSPSDLEREVDRGEVSRTANEWQEYDLTAARDRVTELLDQIHPRYAEAIRYRVLEGHSRDQTAERLGVTTATCDVVLHRALVALKKIINSTNPDAP